MSGLMEVADAGHTPQGRQEGRDHRPDFLSVAVTYGALKEDEAHKLKLLEQENQRLRRIVAEQALDISMLKDLQRGKF